MYAQPGLQPLAQLVKAVPSVVVPEGFDFHHSSTENKSQSCDLHQDVDLRLTSDVHAMHRERVGRSCVKKRIN